MQEQIIHPDPLCFAVFSESRWQIFTASTDLSKIGLYNHLGSHGKMRVFRLSDGSLIKSDNIWEHENGWDHKTITNGMLYGGELKNEQDAHAHDEMMNRPIQEYIGVYHTPEPTPTPVSTYEPRPKRKVRKGGINVIY